MRLVFITEARFIKLNDGNTYSLESSFAMPLYLRYLEHFDEIVIVARTKNGTIDEVIAANLIDIEQVKVIELPYYIGFNQFLSKFFKLKNILKQVISRYVDVNSVVICRIPGRIGSTAITILEERKISYGVEIVGDPYDLFARGVIKHPLRIPLRFLSYKSLKRLAHSAPAALYVTKHKLQERYPCRNFNIGVSDVVIPSTSFAQHPKKIDPKSLIRLISIGSLDQMYKSPDIVLKAIKILTDKDIKCNLSWVGDGKYRQNMENIIEKLNITNNVDFLGKIPSGERIYAELKRADIFLLISRTEGLPRAMVEAMACGLPCIGTPIGGIPELLDQQALVKVNDAQGLADKIQYFIDHPDFTLKMARKNLEVAHTFEENILNVQRKKFYDYLKSIAIHDHE